MHSVHPNARTLARVTPLRPNTLAQTVQPDRTNLLQSGRAIRRYQGRIRVLPYVSGAAQGRLVSGQLGVDAIVLSTSLPTCRAIGQHVTPLA
jgi:hypothetical protein